MSHQAKHKEHLLDVLDLIFDSETNLLQFRLDWNNALLAYNESPVHGPERGSKLQKLINQSDKNYSIWKPAAQL